MKEQLLTEKLINRIVRFNWTYSNDGSKPRTRICEGRVLKEVITTFGAREKKKGYQIQVLSKEYLSFFHGLRKTTTISKDKIIEVL